MNSQEQSTTYHRNSQQRYTTSCVLHSLQVWCALLCRLSFFTFDFLLYLIPAACSLGLLAILNPAVSSPISRPAPSISSLVACLTVFFAFLCLGVWRATATGSGDHGFFVWICHYHVCIRVVLHVSEAYHSTNVHTAFVHSGGHHFAGRLIRSVFPDSKCCTMGSRLVQLHRTHLPAILVCNSSHQLGI